MAYCTLEDIGQLLSHHTLVRLTQDVSGEALMGSLPNVIHDKVLSDAIRYADELIDADLRGRYVLPLQTVPTVLRDMAVNLVTHRLYLRRPEGQLPEAIKEVYRGSLKMLEALRDGKLTLGIAASGQVLPEPGAFHVRARPARFSGPGGLLEDFE
ncbi:gp436 family protein [Arsenophonus sp. PmNCSU2021_1]|uniref:gp436 family protein n=1 Tax=Arsenophonus sp. PmNCSU2021_1 TaxID=3118989 RepID=UPI002FEFCAAB